ncbi:DUF2071 domain-containing protein [Streptomyces flavidovirens]|uniref:DUF2071 domain-containing protein n=1 Tax=Streptomyces flavidovirens TaxID=67298 RepID=A0ABW6RMI9_9ACTN
MERSSGCACPLRVGWLTQTFVHWHFRPEAVQALVPEELVVDECEEVARVGLTPFSWRT